MGYGPSDSVVCYAAGEAPRWTQVRPVLRKANPSVMTGLVKIGQ